jgi:hypothetical protein
MNERLLALREKRGRLRQKIARDREGFAQGGKHIERLCDGIDAARAGVRWVKRHPLGVGIACAALAALRPVRAWRFTRRAIFLANTWQMLRRRLAKALRPA